MLGYDLFCSIEIGNSKLPRLRQGNLWRHPELGFSFTFPDVDMNRFTRASFIGIKETLKTIYFEKLSA